MNGTVVLDEVICRIKRIYLKDGLVWVYAVSERGDFNVRDNADVSVFDPQGNLIFHVAPTQGDKRSITQDGYLYVDLPLQITEAVR